jgi:hypothetical protein
MVSVRCLGASIEEFKAAQFSRAEKLLAFLAVAVAVAVANVACPHAIRVRWVSPTIPWLVLVPVRMVGRRRIRS